MTQNDLILTNLTVALQGQTLVNLTARIAPGEVLTLMAPSGAGKSTALLAIAGALPPGFVQGGRVILGQSDITHLPTARRQVGLLFQDDILFPHLSVGGNLAFALAPEPGQSQVARMKIVAQALDEIQLSGFSSRDPATLSGGQRARVALARMLLAQAPRPASGRGVLAP